MKFRCKKCNRFIEEEKNPKSDIACPYCGTMHSWMYGDHGWEYQAKDFLKKKCPLCAGQMYISRTRLNTELDYQKRYFMHKCESCNQQVMGISYGYISFVGFTHNLCECEWCGNKISINTESVNQQWFDSKEDIPVYKKEIVKCSFCGNKTSVFYFPYYQDKGPYLRTEKIYKAGRKRKFNPEKLLGFIESNSLYQAYQILHPYHLADFIDKEHYDFDIVYNYLEEHGYEIFESLDMDERRKLDIEKYEREFEKLILKESFLSLGDVVSLSRLLGKTKVWKSLREILIKDHKGTCVICGYKTDDTKALHVHEEWKIAGNILILKSVELICSRCHACKHRNQYIVYRVVEGQNELDDGIPRVDMLTIHLMRVNNVSKEVIYAYREKMLSNRVKEDFNEDFLKKKKESIMYKYYISEGIPCKRELEDFLRKRNLLAEENDLKAYDSYSI